ncbi:MAG: flavodoxin-dependent (E)-4-hydroxy-3-methylbut-2-enyl-diphosphate synthase [Nitrospirota bacterium]|nr:flavodoxin-dependent (E)-4-hydroxy-3-methylbut-2-enyl-diphosphate synthase [Nitrospirota bacterium]
MQITRKKTRQIDVGGVKIGGDAPVSVQSMTVTDTRDVPGTVAEIDRLAEAGCELVRVAVVDTDAAGCLGTIRARSPIPLIADIHFDHKLALMAIESGVDGLRLNPGNIGGAHKVREVVAACKDRGIPIRIGVNAGSLERELLERYGYPTAEAMVESAATHIRILEDLDFFDIKVSLKASHPGMMIDACRLFAARFDYPQHLGVTEAGTLQTGSVKSAVAMGVLLAEGIGDTLRVSLSADPVEEVKVGFGILKSLGLRTRGVNVISCPTCGRLEIDVVRIASEVESRLAHIREPLDVAILGCVVNGIGEGKEADIGIAGGRDHGILFKEGRLDRKVSEAELVDLLVNEAEQMAEKRRNQADSPLKVISANQQQT